MAPPSAKVSNGPIVAGVAQSIAYDDALLTLRHDRQMKRALLGIPFPVAFFCIFVAMLSRHIPTSELYEQAYSVSSVLDSSGTDAITADPTMKLENVQTIGDVFDWLTDTFVPSVFVTEDYNGNMLTKDKWGRIANFNKVLGAVLFKVSRAPIHKCQAAQFLIDLYPNCYDAANATTDTSLISFDKNATEATSIITALKTRGDWLDFSTQQLLITVVAYNGEIQGYTVSKLQLDFHQGGYIDVSTTTTPTISDPYKHRAAIVLDALVGVCLAIALLRPLARFIAIVKSPRTWGVVIRETNFVAVLSGLASSACTVTFYAIWFSMVRLMYAKDFRDNLARLVVSGKDFDPNSKERDGLIAVTNSLETVANMTTALRLVAMATVFALGVDILMQFRYHPRLNILTRTIANALHQFAGFFIVFVVVFLTFAVSGTVLFGDRVEDFSTLPHTMESCVNMLFGNFDYSTIRDLQAPVGMLYYWAYMIVVCLVLLNMMLAIVLDSYAEMTQETAHSRYNASLRRTVQNVLYDRQVLAAQFKKAHQVRSNNHSNDSDETNGSRTKVVFRGRILPDVLEKALATNFAKLKSASAAKDSSLRLTESMLVDLFPEVKLTTDETRATIEFLRRGCRPSDRSSDDLENLDSPLSAVDQVAGLDAEERAELTRALARMETLERKLDLLLSQATLP